MHVVSKPVHKQMKELMYSTISSTVDSSYNQGIETFALSALLNARNNIDGNITKGSNLMKFQSTFKQYRNKMHSSYTNRIRQEQQLKREFSRRESNKKHQIQRNQRQFEQCNNTTRTHHMIHMINQDLNREKSDKNNIANEKKGGDGNKD